MALQLQPRETRTRPLTRSGLTKDTLDRKAESAFSPGRNLVELIAGRDFSPFPINDLTDHVSVGIHRMVSDDPLEGRFCQTLADSRRHHPPQGQ